MTATIAKQKRKRRKFFYGFPFTLFVCASLLFAINSLFSVSAEQLPVKTYTTADGLARDYVNRIKQDSHGFIWICTAEGLSRFDGYAFTNYGVAEGLPNRQVNDILETRNGDYLVATLDGLVQFNPIISDSNGSRFTPVKVDVDVKVDAITHLLEDNSGAVWAGTGNGLYRLDKTANGWHSTQIKNGHGETFVSIGALAFDKKGSLWIGTDIGLYHLLADGNSERYTTQNGLSQDGISRLLLDRDGKMWVGTGEGLTLLVDNPRPGERIAERVYRTENGLLNNFITSIFQSADGRLWIGTRSGLNLYEPNKSDFPFRGYTTAQGLHNINIKDITEDRDGNLWIGAESGGVMRIPRIGFTSYFESDIIGSGRISQLFSDKTGNIYFLSPSLQNGTPDVMRFDGQAFVKHSLNLPKGTQLTWGWNQLIVQDRQGDWWIPTAQGIFRFSGNKTFSALASAQPTKVYTVKDGMDHNGIFRLFEDSRGDLWFATLGAGNRALHRLERSSDKITLYTPEKDGIQDSGATAFANDSEGNLWIGFYGGGVARYSNGRFTTFTEKDGVPYGFVRNLFFDSKKRLWIATSYSGLSRVDNSFEEKPAFINLTTKDGLSSNQITTVTEDKWGQIYVGTGRGVDRLDPKTNSIKHFTTADGLADNFINVSMRDSQDRLWFGTLRGLSRFTPEQDKQHAPPSILISGLRVAGIKQTLSELGQTEVIVPTLNYTQNQLQIDFLSLNYAPGDVIRYQFKLEGGNDGWSDANEQRTVTFPNIPPGNYHFYVRAVNSDGTYSNQPAIVSFRIMPPVWRRWWFIAVCLLVVSLVGFAFIRSRLEASRALQREREERLRELERVRTRIATDLHDDIGSSLTQIAVLSEVARQKSTNNGQQIVEPLKKISSVSNELVETMSDIVWAINPHKDHLNDLAQRMRRFASDVFAAKQISFHFQTPSMRTETPLGANIRREVFLIFKESVNNIVKHANCSRVEIDFKIEGKNLILRLQDDGCGFDAEQEAVSTNGRGNGLLSMKRRARELGGEYIIESKSSEGTTVTLNVPL